MNSLRRLADERDVEHVEVLDLKYPKKPHFDKLLSAFEVWLTQESTGVIEGDYLSSVRVASGLEYTGEDIFDLSLLLGMYETEKKFPMAGVFLSSILISSRSPRSFASRSRLFIATHLAECIFPSALDFL